MSSKIKLLQSVRKRRGRWHWACEKKIGSGCSCYYLLTWLIDVGGWSGGRRKSWTISYKTYNPLDSEKGVAQTEAEGLGICKEFHEFCSSVSKVSFMHRKRFWRTFSGNSSHFIGGPLRMFCFNWKLQESVMELQHFFLLRGQKDNAFICCRGSTVE